MDQELTLPEHVSRALTEFVDTAKSIAGSDLESIVLYGSAAEGRMRATSDVNVLVVLARWDPKRLETLSDPLRNVHAAIALTATFVLKSELAATMAAFAVKYADILRRHRVLCGSDPFTGLSVERTAEIARVRQVLLNLLLRTRERYLFTRLREEQATSALANVAGPLRAAAATLLELEGKPAISPKAALEAVAAAVLGKDWTATLSTLSSARESKSLDKGAAAQSLLRLIEVAAKLYERANDLS